MTTQRTFDWRPNWDPRSDLFRLAYLDCYSTGSVRSNIRRIKQVWLDQGPEGACTGFGAAHVLASTPRPVAGLSYHDAFAFYEEARRWDEWPGESYDGSSVNGAMKALRALGRIRAWRWAKTLEELRHGLSYHGAAEMGSWWYDGMWDTDENGYIHPEGTQVGGHAFALVGYQVNPTGDRRYRIENSWGPNWGDKGGAWIAEPALQRLLDEQGEIAIPVKT